MHLQQRAAFTKARGLPIKGCDQRAWRAEMFHELVQEREWEKVVQEGQTHASLEKHCALCVPFMRKLVLHDVWLAHRHGEGPSGAKCSHFRCLGFVFLLDSVQRSDNVLRSGVASRVLSDGVAVARTSSVSHG